MANLLANPSLWEDNYEYRPPSEWNGTSYAQSTDPSTMSAFTTLYLDEIPADGGSLAGEASVSWADDGFSIWLNFQQWSDDADNFVVFDQVELVNGGTVQFDVAIPAGSTDRILISMGHENGQSNMYYGLSYEVTPASDLVANDDEATTNAGTPVTVDVLANDTLGDEPVALEQLEGPPTIHEQPANGTVSVGADGRITYTPNPGFTGTDEFVYRIATGAPSPANRVDACGISGEGGFEIFDHPDLDFSIPMVIDDGWGSYAAYVPQTGWGTYPRWTPTYFDGQAWVGEGEEYTAYQGDREFTIVLHSGIAFVESGGYWYQDGAYNLWPFDLSKPFQIEFNGIDYAAEFDQNEAILTVTPYPGFPQGSTNYVTIKQEGFEDEDPDWPYSVEHCGIIWIREAS